MGDSLRRPSSSVPVRSLDNVRPTPAKVATPISRSASDRVGSSDPNGPTESDQVRSSDSVGPPLVDVVIEAVVKHYGSVKAAGLSLRVDPSLMMREFKKGNFARLERADDAAKAAIAKALHDTYSVTDPKARAKKLLRDMRRCLDELAEGI